ncbi:MAG: hypothetical protein VW378_03010 [bacterium]
MNTDFLKKTFNLSPQQLSSVKKINRKYKKRFDDNRVRLSFYTMQIKQLEASDTPDLARIRLLLDERSPIKNTIYIDRIKHRLAIQQLLTPQQRLLLETP